MATGFYHTALICLNGHLINGMAWSQTGGNKKHCTECGAQTIDRCLNCKCRIKGYYAPDDITILPYSIPLYCDDCGNPYPWTQEAKKAVYELIGYSEALAELEKSDMIQSVEDLMQNGPRTTLAVLKFKKYIFKAGAEVAKGLKDILTDVLSEAVKKSIWG